LTKSAVPARGRAARARGEVGVVGVVVLCGFALAWLIVALLRGIPAWVDWLYAGASLLAFALYAVDKSAAIDGRERISERALLAIGTVGGWPGAIVAQQALRHKTAKRSFRIRFWVSVAVNVAAFAWATMAMARGPG
jgi:uncharacterized membrane protein YsdA (DUF1294 family)